MKMKRSRTRNIYLDTHMHILRFNNKRNLETITNHIMNIYLWDFLHPPPPPIIVSHLHPSSIHRVAHKSIIGSYLLRLKIFNLPLIHWYWLNPRLYLFLTTHPTLPYDSSLLSAPESSTYNHHLQLMSRLSPSFNESISPRFIIPWWTAVYCIAGCSPKKLFSCQLCGKVLCSKASLKRHIADKHAERQEEYRCIICERVYCSRNSLMTHIYTYHKSRPGELEMKDIKYF